MLREFWIDNIQRGIHPHDVHAIAEHRILDWTPTIASNHAGVFAPGQRRHPFFFRIHCNLYPLPFIGDLENSDVVLLLGNPGFDVFDYTDEYENDNHEEALTNNFLNGNGGFFPLTPASANTGAGQWWESCLANVISLFAAMLHLDIEIARENVVSHISVVESFAYHSKKMPNLNLENIPSSVTARTYVHALLPLAEIGEKLIFVWRSKRFWNIPARAPGVIFRPANQAQGRMRITESEQIASFLAERHTQRAANAHDI